MLVAFQMADQESGELILLVSEKQGASSGTIEISS